MKRKKSNKLIYLIIIIFVIALVLYFLSIRSKYSSFKAIDKTKEINEVKKKGDTVVGWLRVEGTNIDLPIIQDIDTINISDRDYDYAWIYSIPGNDSNHLNFASHNIRNVSRKPIVGDNTMTGFEQLMSFIYPKFTTNNQYVAYTDKYGKTSLYRIYAVSLTKHSQDVSYKNIYSDEEQKQYIAQAKKESMYDMNVDVNYSDKLISLLTCTRFYGAGDSYTFKVDARKLRDDEKKELVKVETNDNYVKIKNRMGEGENNEEV